MTFSSELRWSGLRYASGASYVLGAPEVVAPRAEGGETGPVATEISAPTSQWATRDCA